MTEQSIPLSPAMSEDRKREDDRLSDLAKRLCDGVTASGGIDIDGQTIVDAFNALTELRLQVIEITRLLTAERARNAALASALVEFGRHTEACLFGSLDADDLSRRHNECGCGLDAALASSGSPESGMDEAVRALVSAASRVRSEKSSTFKARNGRHVGVQADDGEMCWLVHSDAITELEGALDRLASRSKTAPAPSDGGER